MPRSGIGREVPLDAMARSERKIVHEHLKDRTDVETFSEGEEPRRHLVVAPVVGRPDLATSPDRRGRSALRRCFTFFLTVKHRGC